MKRGIVRVLINVTEMKFPIITVKPFGFRDSFAKTLKEEIAPFLWNIKRNGEYYFHDSKGKKIKVELNRKSILKFLHEDSYREDKEDKNNRVNRKIYFAVFNNFIDVLNGLREVEVHPDYSKVQGYRRIEDDSSTEYLVHRYFGVVKTGDSKPARIKVTVYEKNPERRSDPIIHSQEVTKIELSPMDDNSIRGGQRTGSAETPGTLTAAKLLKGIEKSTIRAKKFLRRAEKRMSVLLARQIKELTGMRR